MTRMARLVAVGLLFIGACGGPRSATSPTPVQSPAPAGSQVTAPPPAPATALSISSFDVHFVEYYGGANWYTPAIVLAETTGNSPAILQSITFSMPNGDTVYIANDAPPGKGCFLTAESKQVPAGGTWSSDSVYGYCLDLDSRASLSGGHVGLTIKFSDLEGRTGEITGVAHVQ